MEPVPNNAGLVAARLGAALVLGVGALAVLRPFWSAIAWAAVLAYTTWPLFRRARARTRRPRVLAVAFSAGVAVGLGIPVGLLLVALADDASALLRGFLDWRGAGSPLPIWLETNQRLLAFYEQLRALVPADPAQAGEILANTGSQISRSLVQLASGVVRNAVTFGFTFVALYGFYVGGEDIVGLGRRLAPLLFPWAPEEFVERLGASVRGVVFGLLGTAMIQGLLAGIGMAVAGIESAVALGAATTLLSFLPGGGGAISLAAAAWLLFQGDTGAAIGLTLWTLLVVSSVDNVLRPIIISGQAQIPFLMVFFGVIGGLATFGVIGLFAGPVLLSVAYTLVQELSHVSAGSTAGLPADPDSGPVEG